MGAISELNELIQDYDTKSKRLIEAIETKILSLPDNNKITRVGANMFTIQFKDLRSANWSPSHYDFKWQYRAIIDRLNKTVPSKYLDALSEIIDKGYIKYGNAYSNRYVLHPVVINHLKSLV